MNSPDAASGATPAAGPGAGPPARTVEPARIRRWQQLLASERDAAALYDRLADSEAGERAEVLRELAETERRHARHWERRLTEQGAAVPAQRGVSFRTRLLARGARLSPALVLPIVERTERSGAGVYDGDPDATAAMAEDERGHARAIKALRDGQVTEQSRGGLGAREGIGGQEEWHKVDRSGALRAAIFGISDGLVSNTALVMGFAGSGASRHAVLLAGVAGLLAGAFSMAAGEYVSMSGQREMFQREIALEAEELEEKPEEELEELVLIYRAKGLHRDQAREVAERIMEDRQVALDTLAREELGLDPDELGSPWSAAFSSLIAFAVGAVVVILPYLFGGGTVANVVAVALAGAAMITVGAAIGVTNGRSPVRSATRQLVSGGLAAAVTYGVGAWIGVQAG